MIIKPFVKWAGGKRRIIGEILQTIPTSFINYYEPFVGGGAVFMELQNDKTFISDVNEELIITYKIIRDFPDALMNVIDIHHNNHCEAYYYDIRDNFTKSSDIEIAARFIYLNKAGFNGLYRVNRNGKFNVSFGNKDKTKLSFYSKINIDNLSAFLKTIDIQNKDYNRITPSKNDFVYFDPPYHDTFSQYTGTTFKDINHVELRNFIDELTNDGVHVLLSNSSTPFILDLYANYNIKTISAPRSINRLVHPSKIDELLISNY